MELYKWITTLLVFVTVSEACRCHEQKHEYDDIWTQFKKVHRKWYCRRDECKRRCIWNKALRRIMRHNLEFDLGKHSFRRGLNKYSDLTREEFVSTMNGFRGTPESRIGRNSTRRSPSLFSTVNLPQNLDWRNEDLVTPVRDQGLCGSCWAFSAVASLESQVLKETRSDINLSEQNLLDCSFSYGNMGCRGGLMTQAFDYIIDNDGIETERTYPYRARVDECRFRESNVAATCRSYEEIESGSEDALMEALVNVGPISVGIDASLESFQDYESGIYDDVSCSSEYLDHAVLLVGYGSEDGIDFWIIKNSYGKSWGENGYGRIVRNNNNRCGIATQACYPVV